MSDAPAAARLGAFDLGCVVVGGIVGVGIFFAPQKVAAVVDGPTQLVVAWCLGGGVAMTGAWVFAELSRLVPGYGGTFTYIERAFGAWPAFLYGWANWLVIQAGALAVIGLVMADNLDVVLYGAPRSSAGRKVAVTLAAIAVFTVVNARGLRLGKTVQNAFTVLKLLAVFGLVVLGLVAGGAPAADATAAVAAPRGWGWAMAAAILPVLFSFGGWQQGAFVAGAARAPLRDVPLGIAAGVAVVVLAYVTINLTYLNLLGFGHAATSATIAADASGAALAAFGWRDLGSRAMAAAIAVSALGIMNTILLAPPWVLHTMAGRGLFFRACGRLHPRFGSPTVGIVVQGGWAAVLLLGCHLAFGGSEGGALATLDTLVTGVVFVDWLFFALCGLALVRLVRRTPAAALAPGFAVVAGGGFFLIACAVTAGALWTATRASLLGLSICVLGLPVGRWLRRRVPGV